MQNCLCLQHIIHLLKFLLLLSRIARAFQLEGLQGINNTSRLCLQHSFETTSFFLSLSLCSFFLFPFLSFLFFILKRRALRAQFNYKNRRCFRTKEVNYSQVLTRINGMSKGQNSRIETLTIFQCQPFRLQINTYISSSCIRIIERMTHSQRGYPHISIG